MKDTTTVKTEEIFEPSFYRLAIAADKINFDALIDSEGGLKVFDHIDSQLKELIKCSNPASMLSPEDYEPLINEHLHGRSLNDYGAWVYYPWNNHLSIEIEV